MYNKNLIIMKKTLFLTVFVFLVGIAFGQTKQEKQEIISKTNVKALQEFAKKKKKEYEANYAKALKMAKEKGWIIRKETGKGLMELQGVTEKGKPIYYITHNADAAESVSTDKVYSGGSLGLDLDGSGMTAGEWDGGDVLTTHQEFNNTGSSRVTDQDGSTITHYHSTHVAGTIIAGGVEAAAKGMAYNANLDAYEWTNDESEMATAAAGGLLISNHSYGYGAGWTWNGSSWQWDGDDGISSQEDFEFGFYGSECVSIDNIALDAPYYLIVKSAGNDRGDGDGQTGYPPDGGNNWLTEGYDCISYKGNAKNILTVGAVEDVTGGYSGNPADVQITDFSSWGPCDDGRIKPDICGNGYNLYSTYDDHNFAYNSISGTSMSAPNVTGSLLLLQEHNNETHGSFMKAATLKALAIHTADECGDYDGPDYIYGWGLLNTGTAADVISNKDVSTFIKEESLSDGGTYTLDVTATGTEPLVVTIVWADPAGTPVADQLDPTDIMLVNDLDLTLDDGAKTIYYPYKLDGQNPSNAATTGDNDVDNVEKVYIASPSAGTYTITVDHKGTITDGPQDFSLIVTGISNGYAVVTTNSVSNITTNSVDVEGEVVSDNGSTVTERGFVYNTTGAPTTSDNKKQVGSGTGVFSTTISSLSASTTYYVRAYAINSHGTSYGDNKSFTTPCGAISLPYEESFEDPGFPPLCWSSVDNDGDGNDWFLGNSGYTAYDGTNVAVSASWINSNPLTPDNWLISPQLEIAADDVSLTFYVKSQDINFPNEKYDVMVSTGTNAVGDFISIYSETLVNDTWKEVNLTLSGYNGQNIYIAFRHWDCTDEFQLILDNISIEEIFTCTPPSTQASNFSVDATNDNDVTISWDRGDGDEVIVLAKEGVAVDNDPSNGVSYTANASFASGDKIGTGNYVVYSGTGTPVNINSLTAGTDYHFAVYEYNTADYCYLAPGLTGNVTTTGTAPCDPCYSYGNTTFATSTTGVLFNTIDNSSAKPTDGNGNAYSDYTSQVTDVEIGSNYDLTIHVNTDGNYTDTTKVWIDWNQNCDFTDPGEEYDLGSATDVADGPTSNSPLSITIPTGASTGNTIMRVSTKYYTAATSCQTDFDGEVEDYTINVLPEGLWTGATSTAWSETGNWTYSTVPTAATDVTIPAAPANQPVVSATGDSVNTLTVETGASLTIDPGAELTVVSDFTNHGSFTINSDATGTGSVITNGTVSGAGSYDVNLYLTAQRWWYVSSPIAGNTSDVFGLDADNVLYWWNETNTGTHGWNEITSTTTLNDLQGYAYYKNTAGVTTKQFTGDINTGNYGAVDNLTSEGSTFQGFNLIGNPYPSPIHLDTLPDPTGITLTNVYPTVWFRNDANLATYNWSSGTGQNNGEAVVPNMQGFWVKVADGSSAGGIQFTNAARTHMKPHGIYKNEEKNIFRLTLNSNGNKDEAVIGFYDAAQDIEDSYDSEKMFAQFGATPELYSIINGKSFAINGYSKFIKEHLAIPLGIKSNVNTNATLLAENIGDFNIYPVVYLEDKQTGDMVDLNKQTGYEFAMNSGVVNNRFVLHLGQNATSIKDTETQTIDIYAYTDVIYLRNNGIKGHVMVYDMLGKTIVTQNIEDGETINKINMHGYTGNFVVRFVTSEGVYMQKVFVH